jgi:hypothetical protein
VTADRRRYAKTRKSSLIRVALLSRSRYRAFRRVDSALDDFCIADRVSSHTGIRQCRTYLRWLLFDICAQRRNSIVEDRINGISPTEIDQLAPFQQAGGPPNSRKTD